MTSLRTALADVAPSAAEVAATLPGDEVVAAPDVVMDRAFDVAAEPEVVWPWLEQLGKRRAGWYLPRTVERLVPPGRRAARHLDDRWRLRVGQVVPDWGGRDATFEVVRVEPPTALVYRSRRGATELTWALVLTPGRSPATTRVHLRLRLSPVAHVRLAEAVGGSFDLLTVAGLAAGLRERVVPGSS
ncbi:MAG: hypothetical protein Q7T56_14805 [Nocardioidaceae bacterium]|nr:hypothetical protein [Nocardioidaceae bacterium]